MHTEIWRSAYGLEGFYQISNHGRVRSLDRSFAFLSRGKYPAVRQSAGRLLKTHVDGHYYRILLCVEGKRVKKDIHVMVCEAWHGPRPPGHVAAHLNGNPLDNDPANLAWSTYKENSGHMVIHGRSLKGERHHKAKLNCEQVKTIRNRFEQGASATELSREYGMATSSLRSIKTGQTWTHLL